MLLGKVTRSLCRAASRFDIVPECQARLCSTATQAQPSPSRIEKSINQVTLLGRVGADPQKRGSEEHPVVIFSVATNVNQHLNSRETLQKTDWHRVCVFKPYLRDTVYKYITKGQRVLVQGRISYGDVKNEHGETQNMTSIIAEDITFFNSNKGFSDVD